MLVFFWPGHFRRCVCTVQCIMQRPRQKKNSNEYKKKLKANEICFSWAKLLSLFATLQFRLEGIANDHRPSCSAEGTSDRPALFQRSVGEHQLLPPGSTPVAGGAAPHSHAAPYFLFNFSCFSPSMRALTRR